MKLRLVENYPTEENYPTKENHPTGSRDPPSRGHSPTSWTPPPSPSPPSSHLVDFVLKICEANKTFFKYLLAYISFKHIAAFNQIKPNKPEQCVFYLLINDALASLEFKCVQVVGNS